MPKWAGGSGTGRSQRASVPEPLDYRPKGRFIAVTGQILPGACPTPSNQVGIGQTESNPVKPFCYLDHEQTLRGGRSAIEALQAQAGRL